MAVAKELNFLFDFPLTAESTVIEVGTYTGEWAEEINRRYKCQVFTFEPLKRHYNDAVKRLGDNPKVVVSNFAVGNAERNGTLTVKGSMTGEFADGEETHPCRFMSIKTVLQWAAACSLLSLNCEGGEFEILEWLLANDAMAAIPNLLVQFHKIVPNCETRYADIQEGLKRTHEAIYHDGWTWQIWSRK